ncbi:MAG: integral membrane protein TerC family [Candidatus Karelsulcia muelleri]|nr:MAG: integral membrane protein TerC family [Candidatus Karelsulcia muelleri]
MDTNYYQFFKEIVDHPLNSISILINIVLIEALLSIDNATILTTLVKNINKKDRKKALNYGIFGAYFFRIISLIFAAVIINMWWLKLIGGLYLIYLGINHFLKTQKEENNFFKINFFSKILGTILYVELIDFLFSIDNIFAGISYSNNPLLIFLGVFISLFLLRISTVKLLKLTEKYSSLEDSAFFIIILLGLKLIISLYEKIYQDDNFTLFLQSKSFQISFTLTNIIILIIPIFYLNFLK